MLKFETLCRRLAKNGTKIRLTGSASFARRDFESRAPTGRRPYYGTWVHGLTGQSHAQMVVTGFTPFAAPRVDVPG